MPAPFSELLTLFRRRFLENDALAEGASFDVNIYQLLGMLAAPGLFITLYLLPTYAGVALHGRPDFQWELRADRLFFSAYSFAATGFATVFQWDMLFPDRHDFLALGAFPLRMRDVFAAKLAALGILLAAVVLATNVFALTLMPLLSLGIPEIRSAGFTRVFLAQIASSVAPAVFAFMAVSGLQGVLINVLSPRFFRRVTPWIQMGLMSLMVMTLLLFPLYSMALRPLGQHHPGWLRFFPPYWYAGAYELFVPGPDGLFASLFVSLGRLGVEAIAVAAMVFALAWGVGYKRHYRRTLESEDVVTCRRSPTVFHSLLATPEERAVFHFTASTLARSTKHRLFLATYLSVGLSVSVLTLVTLSHGVLGISRDGARSFPLLLIFFVVSGFRAGFQFPAELPSNWLFRVSESNYAEAARRATRKCVVVLGLLPAILIFLPVEIGFWGLAPGLFHAVFQAISGALLIELLFWNFDRVPFTCSYFPGSVNLALLAAVYLYGFTSYAFRMADLEAWLELSPVGSFGLMFGSIVVLSLLWKRNARRPALRFDAREQAIESLNLT